MKTMLGRIMHGPFTISVSFSTSRIIGACTNQRPIFTPFFLPWAIVRTLKTEEGEIPKI